MGGVLIDNAGSSKMSGWELDPTMSSGGNGGVDEQDNPRRIMFDPKDISGTPRSFEEDRPVTSVATTMRDVTGARLDDDESVASEGDVDISLRKRGRQRIEGVERDKHGEIIRMCGMAGCQYKTGHDQHMKVYKAAKHGINVVWFSCDQDNCDHKSKKATNLKQHKQGIHNISVVWHQCDSCNYKAKKASTLKQHKQFTHNIDVICKKHKQAIHNVDVRWHHCDS